MPSEPLGISWSRYRGVGYYWGADSVVCTQYQPYGVKAGGGGGDVSGTMEVRGRKEGNAELAVQVSLEGWGRNKNHGFYLQTALLSLSGAFQNSNTPYHVSLVSMEHCDGYTYRIPLKTDRHASTREIKENLRKRKRKSANFHVPPVPPPLIPRNVVITSIPYLQYLQYAIQYTNHQKESSRFV